jgi:hypothetical protein
MRFLRWFIVAAALGFGLMIGLVIVVNPRGEFPGDRFPQPEPNYRALKLANLERYALTHHAEGVILGSSRAAKLDPDDLRRRYDIEFFNMSVLGADAEDYLATWRLFVRREGLPRILLIGLDADAFARGGRSVQFSHNLLFLSAFSGTSPGRLKRVRHTLRTIRQAVNLDYLHDVARGLWGTVAPPETRFEFRPDGVLMYPKFDRLRAAGELELARVVSRCVAKFVTRSLTVDSARFAALRRVLEEARAGHTRVIIWLTPFHPALARALAGDSLRREQLASIRELAQSLVSEYGVELHDLSELDSYGGDAGDWYDCVHFGRENARRIEAALAPEASRP